MRANRKKAIVKACGLVTVALLLYEAVIFVFFMRCAVIMIVELEERVASFALAQVRQTWLQC